MHYQFDLVPPQNRLHTGSIHQIAHLQRKSLGRASMTQAQIIQHHRVMSPFGQRPHGMRSDITSTTYHQNVQAILPSRVSRRQQLVSKYEDRSLVIPTPPRWLLPLGF
jgi:hypothetical protein